MNKTTIDSRINNGPSGLQVQGWMSDVLIANNTIARLSGAGSGLLFWTSQTVTLYLQVTPLFHLTTVKVEALHLPLARPVR